MKDYRKICQMRPLKSRQRHAEIRSDIILNLQGSMTRLTASVVAILLASSPGVANTRTDR
jgi:hypothetical protein